MKYSSLLIFMVLAVSACGGIFPAPAAPTMTPSPEPSTIPIVSMPTLWISPAVPEMLKNVMKVPDQFNLAGSSDIADYIVDVSENMDPESKWIYALTAPFPTIPNGVSLAELQQVWQGGKSDIFPDKPILMTRGTLAAFESLWGKANENSINLVMAKDLAKTAWQEKSWALVPFEELQPELKVLEVDGKSPLNSDFDQGSYPLIVDFSVKPNLKKGELKNYAENLFILPKSNFNPELMTSVLMTGTTALVRSTAERMETKGISYPGEKIGSILQDADFTHMSNEVSFTPDCPKPDPWFINLRFCSNPEYIRLLEEMSVDIVELTGNHLLDYNPDGFIFSSNLYKELGIRTFGGGGNLQEAREPLLIEHNGNRIAFIGCNPVGPDYVWATEKSPGAASCDFEEYQAKIKELKAEDLLVIATLQDQENYEFMPVPEVKKHLDELSEAGADIVSGSQAHFPQGFAFSRNGLIHYGLGNLFFDQMDYPVVGTRREFYDKHFFYDGKYIGTLVFTGMLEDYAQPRPMTADERSQFLSDIFAVSGW
jgi:poly-gamma-glutamate synthesis protein (capsule biosynthesis protein)